MILSNSGCSGVIAGDPNHLFVGNKLNANTDSCDTVLRTTSKFTDLVFYQMYARYEVQKPGLERWSNLVDKPVINGDSAFTMITDTMPRPYGPVADTYSVTGAAARNLPATCLAECEAG